MVLPVVVIEVAPPDARPSFPAELSAACSDAVRRGRCVIARRGTEPHPSAVAIVSWGGDQLRVRVQVGVRRTPGTGWRMRDMRFKEADAPVERWRAVGLTIATLVGELPGYAAASPPPPAAQKPQLQPRPPGKPPPSAPPPTERWWLEAGALVGPGLSSGAPRGGGFAGGAYLLGDLPLLAHVSLGYAARPADAHGLSANFLTLQAGVGVWVGLDAADLELDGRIGVSLERVGASATRNGESDSGSRLLPAWHLGANLAWPAHGFIALVGGADAWAFQSPTRISVEGETLGRVPGTGALARLGVRLRLP